MTTEHFIESRSLSVAWARALREVAQRPDREIGPLVVSITGFAADGTVIETPSIRAAIDSILEERSKQTVATVANTIFPASLWNPAAPRTQLYDRYRQIAARVAHASKKNRRGVYFDRMLTGGPTGAENQIEHALAAFKARPNVRRSVLQVATFNPGRDHSTSAQLGFPCLQHITFAPVAGALNVNAFYATQYLVERGYGNYLGLCSLGRFVAYELGVPLARMTCLVGVAQCDAAKSRLLPVFSALDGVLESGKAELPGGTDAPG